MGEKGDTNFSWDVERPCRVSDLDRVFKAKKVLFGQENQKSEYKN